MAAEEVNYRGESWKSVYLTKMARITLCKGDVTNAPEGYAIAHCISKDAKMGAGVALSICSKYPENRSIQPTQIGKTILKVTSSGRFIFNVVTKDKYWHKPNEEDFCAALHDLKMKMSLARAYHLAIPKLGCGRDRLNWGKVLHFLLREFEDYPAEILVFS